MRLDQMIEFNQMIITSTQLLWDMPDQPLWLPLVVGWSFRWGNFLEAIIISQTITNYNMSFPEVSNVAH